MSAPEIERVSDHCWVVQWEDTFAQLWGTRTDAEDARRVLALAERFVAARSAPRLALVYIEADSAPPDGAARGELGRLAALFRGHSTAIAYVYTGSGFRAAAIRSVMGAILLVGSLQSGSSVTPRTFAGPVPALAFLASRLPAGHPVRADRRLAIFEGVLRDFRDRPAASRGSSMPVAGLDRR